MDETDKDYGKDWRHLQIILRDDEVERIAQRVVELLEERKREAQILDNRVAALVAEESEWWT